MEETQKEELTKTEIKNKKNIRDILIGTAIAGLGGVALAGSGSEMYDMGAWLTVGVGAGHAYGALCSLVTKWDYSQN